MIAAAPSIPPSEWPDASEGLPEASASVSGSAWLGDTGELAGLTFGRLTVESPGGLDAEGRVLVWCRCRCGRAALRRVLDLREFRTRACRVCEPPPPPQAAASWEAEKARARERRRERRAKEPEFRAREAAWAKRYRERQSQRGRAMEPRACAVCGRACPARRRAYCTPACMAVGRSRRA